MSTIVVPRARRFSITAQHRRRASGSKPVVGSSRKISSGSPASASAKSRRRRCPPERRRTTRVALRGELDDREQLVERARRPVEAAPRVDQLADPEVQREPALLQHDTGARAQLRGVRGRVEAEDTHGTRRRVRGSPRGSRPWSSCRRRWVRAARTPRLERPRDRRLAARIARRSACAGRRPRWPHPPLVTATSPRYISVSKCQACMLARVPVEKLTPERRRQQTRDVLIAAATEVFARARLRRRGARGDRRDGRLHPRRDLQELRRQGGPLLRRHRPPQRAGDRGVPRRSRRTARRPNEWDISRLAELWRASVERVRRPLFAIGKEYELYVLRNPDARPRAVAHRRKQRDLVAAFIDEVAEQSGMTLRLPAATLASIILAAADGLDLRRPHRRRRPVRAVPRTPQRRDGRRLSGQNSSRSCAIPCAIEASRRPRQAQRVAPSQGVAPMARQDASTSVHRGY